MYILIHFVIAGFPEREAESFRSPDISLLSKRPDKSGRRIIQLSNGIQALRFAQSDRVSF
jgi:hypothetical protein